MASAIVKSSLPVMNPSILTLEDFSSKPDAWKESHIPEIMTRVGDVVSSILPQLPRVLCSIVAEYIDNARDIDLDDLGYRKKLAPFLDKIGGAAMQYRFVFGSDNAVYFTLSSNGFFTGMSNGFRDTSNGYHLKTDGGAHLATIERSNIEQEKQKERKRILTRIAKDYGIPRASLSSKLKQDGERELQQHFDSFGIGCFQNNLLLESKDNAYYSMVAAFPEATPIKMEAREFAHGRHSNHPEDSWELVASAEWHLDRDLEVTTPNDGESTPTLQVSGKRKRDPKTSTQSVSTVTSSSVSTTQERLSTKRPK